MQWKEEYAIGVPHIDRQHKELFQIVTRMERTVEDGNSSRNKRICMEAVKYLKCYTKRHFADEEDFQIAVQYAGYAAHKALHDDFAQTVLLQEQLLERNYYGEEAVLAFLATLIDWLVSHIMKEDKAIVHGMSPEQLEQFREWDRAAARSAKT